MKPQREWIEEWIKRRDQLTTHKNLNAYFDREQLGDVALETIRIGRCFIPTGEILVRDPIDLLYREELPYFVTAPIGKYPVELSVAQDEDGERHCAAVRIKFNYRPGLRFEQALTGREDIEGYGGGIYGVFGNSGWLSFCDERAHQDLCDYAEKWEQQNPGKSYQFDQLEPMLENNVVDFVVPNTSSHILMFKVEEGSRRYPVYWGQDEEKMICQLVIWILDLQQQDSDIPQEERAEYNMGEDMPEICWDGSAFRGKINLREWNSYFGVEEMIPFTVLVGDLSDDEILDGCEWLLAHQYQLLDRMMEALLDRYPLMQVEYGHLMSDNHPDMPNIAYKSGFSEFLYPQHIVLDLEEKMPKVTAAFSCTWDEEEGFGISVQQEKILKIGTAAFVPEWNDPTETEDQE